MRAGPDSYFHLSYCSNIHPGETWEAVDETLRRYVPALKRSLAPTAPFGIGLRLSDQASRSLIEPAALMAFYDWLRAENLYVFTMNGFPYGGFHRQVVKDTVYMPDWRTRERVDYTVRLGHILAGILPQGVEGGISTSPLSYKHWLADAATVEETYRVATRHMADAAYAMAEIAARSGRTIHIDIEPEPDCLIENTAETVAFFTDWLWTEGVAHLGRTHGLTAPAAEALLRHHVRVCYDTCHFAVEFEAPEASLQAFVDHGIGIGKIQVSAAIRVDLPAETAARAALAEHLGPYAESTYLHQVIERRADGSLHHYPDLDAALPHIQQPDAREWRIHFHVPLFVDRFGPLASTRDNIAPTLDFVAARQLCDHLEVETYTWEVLPAELKVDLGASIQRELAWTLGAITP
ncbi:MAG: metabolite traffic protein EboE [Rhodothermales bacterium]